MKYILSIALAILSISSCSNFTMWQHIKQQGNLLPKSKLTRLKLGMSKNTVAAVMGTTLLEPMFNLNRWDYAYTYQKNNSPMHKKRVVLYFSNNKLTKITT